MIFAIRQYFSSTIFARVLLQLRNYARELFVDKTRETGFVPGWPSTFAHGPAVALSWPSLERRRTSLALDRPLSRVARFR
jgi:hypothetical protein